MNDWLWTHLLLDWYLAHVWLTWIVVLVVFFGVSGSWYVWWERRRSRVSLPDGTVFAFADGHATESPQRLAGSLMLVGVGTYGWRQIARYLQVMEANGLGGLVGSILVVENDLRMQGQCRADIPAPFRDRLHFAASDAFAGGFQNKPTSWTMARIALWANSLEEATETFIEGHNRRNHHPPSDILFFLSLGGSAPCGVPVVQLLTERFAEVLVTGFTTLPEHTPSRERFAALKGEYERYGVHGWVVSDNLGADKVTADAGMATLLGALCQAALRADQSTALNNVMALALPEERGGILRYDIATAHVTAHPLVAPSGKVAGYFVYKQQVVERVHKALVALREGNALPSVAVPLDTRARSVFDVVVLNLFPPDVTAVGDAVVAGRKADARFNPGHIGELFGRHNYEVIVAGLADPALAATRRSPVTVLRLALAGAALDTLVLPPGERDGQETLLVPSPIAPAVVVLDDPHAAD